MTAQAPNPGVVVRLVYGALRRLDRCSNVESAFLFAAGAEGVALEAVGPVIDDAMRAATGKDRAALTVLDYEHQRLILRATGGHLMRSAATSRGVGAL
ncbi:MAG: hypothetical protein U5N53_28340 [Mycobacterium sp.]|nr:hypothetical protein [Mycobacterium sp.]